MAVDEKTPAPEMEIVSAPDSAAPSSGADDRASSSDADQQGESKESLLEAVQKAVPELRENAEKKADRDEEAPPARTEPKAETDDTDLPDEVAPDELAKYSRTAQKRIKKLSRQRDALNGEVVQLRTMVPAAQAADQVTTYLRNADIGKDDFLMGLELMAAMRRGDFRMFYEGVKPYMKLCEEYLGVALPEDLAQQVNQGQMTTQAAMMYSKERMDRAMAQTNAARQQQALQHQQQSYQQTFAQQQKQQLAMSVRDTVDKWETNLLRSDPDYKMKQPAVQNTIHSVMSEQGPPQSPAHALAIANESLRRVNEQYRAWAPQRRPTYRSPSSTGRTAGAAPEPKNLMEVVQFTREAHR